MRFARGSVWALFATTCFCCLVNGVLFRSAFAHCMSLLREAGPAPALVHADARKPSSALASHSYSYCTARETAVGARLAIARDTICVKPSGSVHAPSPWHAPPTQLTAAAPGAALETTWSRK